MLLIVPTANGLRLGPPPAATLLIAALILMVAAWSLPGVARLRGERAQIEEVLRSSQAGETIVAGTSTQELGALRRAALGADLAALDARDPLRNWGYTRDGTAWRAVTALFVHADWLHLAVNWIPLLVLGACLEQVWGSLCVLGLFLAGGTASMLLDASLGPPGLIVGSSGAVATLLGACAVRFRSRPVRWRYAYFDALRLRRGKFEIPVALLVGLWLLQQVTGLFAPPPASGIAFVSHLGGFALGAAYAAARTAARAATPAPA